jgi:hypothetical protein
MSYFKALFFGIATTLIACGGTAPSASQLDARRPRPQPQPQPQPQPIPLPLPAAPSSHTFCAELAPLASRRTPEAAAALDACIARTLDAGIVELPAGTYFLAAPYLLSRPVTLQTAGTGEADGRLCDPRTAHGCAVLAADANSPAFDPLAADNFLMHVDAAGAALNHLVFDMGGKTGGPLLNGQNIRIVRNGFTGARRTSMVNATAASGTVVVQNVSANNGQRAGRAWSDGFTFLGADRLTVEGNTFYDCTDVPLIFGGCADCSIRGNTIIQSGDPNRGSFAALGMYTWAHTSGNYTNTVIAGNRIECNGQCGFGLYVGNYSWNDGPPIQNGLVDGNTIIGAQIGIYIDHAVGTTITDNNGILAPTGGRWTSSCGKAYGPSVLMMVTDPVPGAVIQIGIGATAPNLFRNHKTLMDLRGCVPNWSGIR